ncbi:MAG: S41 family peptidase [Dysgonamonadaceae bacterium]|jgi:carboxyl-terminal processing protease|nr:S41 family peptidase [Dysgonamonadaceae bacterium]
MKSVKNIGLSVGGLVIGMAIGYIVFGSSSDKSCFFGFINTPDNKIASVLDIIRQDYVDSVDMNDLTEDAITGIINELDPHSSYIPTSELQTVNEEMEGHFGGIGVTYYLFKDTMVVLSAVHGSPASQAGILPGDRIVFVNDNLLAGETISEETVSKTLRGPIGDSLHLGIKRKTSDTIVNYTLVRGEIPVSTVKAAYEIEEGIGFIKIFDKFSHTTYNEFIKAITQLTNKGCRSFIIDLRMNGGGMLDAAINIINEFLPEGKMIVYAEGKAFRRSESISDGTGNLPENQVVVLIDQLSASAGEVVAGAIQDNDRGLIIGRRSFGKGLVQNQIELADKSAIRLTIARYFTPSGRNIQRKYELGQSEKYNQDWIEQLSNGEGFFADSIKIDTTSVFKTVHGRTVYGGGGIIPDVFIPIDTAHITSYYLKLENHRIFEKFAFDYFDNNMDLTEYYPDYQSLMEYLKTQPVFYELIRYAEENGIKRRSALIHKSYNQILTNAYACILSNFFGDEAFYYALMQNDPVVDLAIQALREGYAQPQAIIREKYKSLSVN